MLHVCLQGIIVLITGCVALLRIGLGRDEELLEFHQVQGSNRHGLRLCGR